MQLRIGVMPGLFILLSLLGCTSHPVVESDEVIDPVTEVAGLLAGSFDSAEQASADHEFFNVLLHMTRIWPERSDGQWLYVEQAIATSADKPYRQRVYQVVAEGNAVLSRVYTVPGDPLIYAGGWRDTSRLAALTAETLSLRDGCAIRLQRQGAAHWAGATEDNVCASELRGASYATSTVTLTARGVQSWDRGYDAAGKQVWGAVTGPYIFVRRH